MRQGGKRRGDASVAAARVRTSCRGHRRPRRWLELLLVCFSAGAIIWYGWGWIGGVSPFASWHSGTPWLPTYANFCLVAAAAAGVRHVLYVSIVGIDRVPLGYYRTKLATEAVVRDSGVPFTILRATQFPSLVDTLFTVSSRLGPLIVDPGFRVRPVHVQDVAERIGDLLGEPATGQTVELAGPQVLTFGETCKVSLRTRNGFSEM